MVAILLHVTGVLFDPLWYCHYFRGEIGEGTSCRGKKGGYCAVGSREESISLVLIDLDETEFALSLCGSRSLG